MGLKDHSGKAAAAATALVTSSTVQQGASAITSPVLEFVTGMYFVVFDSRHSLFTQYLNRLGPPIPISPFNRHDKLLGNLTGPLISWFGGRFTGDFSEKKTHPVDPFCNVGDQAPRDDVLKK